MLYSSARPLAPALSPRPGAGWCCSLLTSPLHTPYTIIDNLCTNSPIITLPDCSLLSVDSRRRPLSSLDLLLSLLLHSGFTLLSFFTFRSSTLLTSSPFPSMSFATFVALRSRNIASAAKGPKVHDLI